MGMIVRAFNSIEYWEESKLEDLPLCAISSWSSVNDNDCSVFELPSFNKDDYKWIVLRLLAENLTIWGDGFDLFYINEQGIKSMNLRVISDKKKKLNCLHENIKDVNYSTFNHLVNYTFANKNNVLKCGLSEIKRILMGLSNEDFTLFINYHYDYNLNRSRKVKVEKFIKKIHNIYFKGKINECPIYLTNKQVL